MKNLFGVTEMFCSFIMEVVTWIYILVKIHLKWVYFIICKSYLNKIDLKSKNTYTHTKLYLQMQEKKNLGNKVYEGPVKSTEK